MHIPFQTRPGTCLNDGCTNASIETRLVASPEEERTKDWKRQPCEACRRAAPDELDAQHQIADEVTEARARLTAQRLALLAVPPLYADARLDSFRQHGTEEDRRLQVRAIRFATRYVEAWPQAPVITVFAGGYGTGKTHLAYAIARALVEQHQILARVCVLSDLIRDLREAWGARDEGGLSEAQRLAKYRDTDLLVIDEVSRHAFYGQPQQHLYDLVAWRETQRRPTILTTNDTGDALTETLGPALASRTSRWRGVVVFGDADYRVTPEIRGAA